MLSPIAKALAQLDDPVFASVLLRSFALSLLAFLTLLAGCTWSLQHLVAHQAWLGHATWLAWLAGIAGGLAAALAALWLFVPAALLIATLFSDQVAAAVDRRSYPHLPVPRGAPLAVQFWDGIALGARVLGFQLLSLVLALLIPGIGLLLGWAITGWAIGRGLFVAVAMRRMNRPAAIALYRRQRLPVLAQGALLAAASTIPLLNLLVPLVGIAALTHVLNAAPLPPTLPRPARLSLPRAP